MAKKTTKKVTSLKKEIKARKAKIAKQEGKLKSLKKKLKKYLAPQEQLTYHPTMMRKLFGVRVRWD